MTCPHASSHSRSRAKRPAGVGAGFSGFAPTAGDGPRAALRRHAGAWGGRARGTGRVAPCMRPIRSTRLAAALVALALLASPAGALAAGGPASDILVIEDTFFPYQPKVSPNVAPAVNHAAARAKAAG